MVRFRDEDDNTTLFQFGTVEKIFEMGSLFPKFTSKIKRNRRNNAKDILHKKGISNREFSVSVVLTGADQVTNLTTLSGLAENQTTIFLDTEGLNDDYNGKYDFNGEFKSQAIGSVKTIITFGLIENVNG